MNSSKFSVAIALSLLAVPALAAPKAYRRAAIEPGLPPQAASAPVAGQVRFFVFAKTETMLTDISDVPRSAHTTRLFWMLVFPAAHPSC